MNSVFNIVRSGDRAGLERAISSGEAYPTLTDTNGNTLLHIAVELKRNEVGMIELLIANSWDVNAQNNLGASPLHYVALRKDSGKHVAALLLRHQAITQICTSLGHTPLHLACERYKAELVQILLDHKAIPGCVDQDNNSPLHVLLLSPGRDTVAKEILELLLRAGGRIEMRNKDGNDALLLACIRGYSKVCQVLIQNGSNLRVTNANGDTVVHCCAKAGHSELIDMLLDLEIPFINVPNAQGDTPLHLAVRNNHAEAATVLLRKGSSINMKNLAGKSPLDLLSNDEKNIFAIKHPDLVKLVNSRRPKNKPSEEEDILCKIF